MRMPSDLGAMYEDNNILNECRACLRNMGREMCHNLFQPWSTPWACPGAIIANDLAELANIEILETDSYSKSICLDCYKRLEDACSFIVAVRKCDVVLKQNCSYQASANDELNTSWPKPILVHQQINDIIDNNVEIKQEVLSEDEVVNNYMELNFEPNMDIKVEPEEINIPDQNITAEKNGAFPLTQENKEKMPQNGTSYGTEEYLDNGIKEEPVSDNENEVQKHSDNNRNTTLSLECLLCMKKLNSISALKGHVLANHSYKSVKRKTKKQLRKIKKPYCVHICVICRKTFRTLRELATHSTIHSDTSGVVDTERGGSDELAPHMTHSDTSRSPVISSIQGNEDLGMETDDPTSSIMSASKEQPTTENFLEDETIIGIAAKPSIKERKRNSNETKAQDLDVISNHRKCLKTGNTEYNKAEGKKIKDTVNILNTEDSSSKLTVPIIKEEIQTSDEDTISIPEDQLEQNMEVHLAINPIIEEANYLDNQITLQEVKIEHDS